MAPFLNGESELSKTFEPVKNGVDAITAWADPSPAAFDFRSKQSLYSEYRLFSGLTIER